IGQTTQTIDALNHATSYAFDDAGRRTSATDALNHVTSFSYDNAGNQTSVTDALNRKTQFVYDAANRRIQTIYPDQSSDSTTYDTLGRRSAKTDQGGKVTQFGYDSIGRLATVTQFLNSSPLVTSYSYDELGNRVTQTDANGHVTRFAYDQRGHRTSRTLPLGMSESYGYDAAGNMTSRQDFSGRTTTFTYDSMNQLMGKTADPFFSTGACAGGVCGATQITYTYDAMGRRTSMADASGTTNYTYDTRNRLLTKAAPAGTLAYTYDVAGNILSLNSSNAGGASMTYTYDALNRLASATDASGSTTYSYDAVGNLSGFAYPNGVSTTYDYNTLNRLTQMQSICAAGTGCGTPGTAVSRYAYTLDTAGNRLSVAELGGRAVNYAYDDLYRLASETISGSSSQNGALSYQYDSVGNRLHRNSTVPALPATGLLNYDANDRTATDPYDNNGNLLNAGAGSNIYDFENRLVQAGGVQLVYDGDGNRISETVAGATTRYLVADQNLTGYAQVMDELQSGAVTRTYSYGLELINERQTIGGTPKTSFYGFDGHGSVRFLMDSTGAITDTYDYDAFGNLLSQTGTTPNNYLFASEQFDPVLGIYYNRARYYDQRQGRFWTMDTYEGDPQSSLSLHKYLYASANPVNRIDPTGHEDIAELMTAAAISVTLTSISNILISGVFAAATISPDTTVDALTISFHGTLSGAGWTAEGGFDLLYQLSTHKWFAALTDGLGTNPLGAFAVGRGAGGSVTFGVVMNSTSPQDMSGLSVSAVWPLSILRLIPGALFNGNKSWGLLSQLAKNVHNVDLLRHASLGLGLSTSGSPFANLALRSNAFGSFLYDSTTFYPVSAAGLQGFLGDIRQGFGGLMSVAESITGPDSFAQSGDQILSALDAIP
ncbi:MAG TPA: RHS repeat-associated core domain-containing protein, partial [Candidatus Angelobacter sp.]